MSMATAGGFCAEATDSLQWGADVTTLTVSSSSDGSPAYALKTTHKLRDNVPGARLVRTSPAAPRLASGNAMFDAMFAMALEELREDSVEKIVDEAFNHGQPIACHSFVAGEKWPYTWTRDTAYAIDLSLGLLDPLRARDALLFKVASRRAGAGAKDPQSLEIAQDTGSGGSWPISADRVVWAFAADQLMPFLPPDALAAFRLTAFAAVSHTLENDRIAIYDPSDGLYRGEESFLDWREQTYPTWTRNEVLPIGTAKALSTNVLHVIAMHAASRWAAALGETTLQQKYLLWAQKLKEAINKVFWLPERGLYGAQAQLTPGSGVLPKFDMLGEALAVLSGVADQGQASAILQNYPHTPHGPPVIWPSTKGLPIYHNRAVWPFVTAYAVKAAIRASHAAAITHNVLSLMRLSALNLSHMENYEFLSGEPVVADGPLTGPVVNSRRQLWSVAGYLGAVLDVVGGLKATNEGIRFQPALTRGLHEELFAKSSGVTLANLSYQGHRLDVRIVLPALGSAAGRDSIYRVGDTRLNDKTVARVDGLITPAELKAGINSVEITLLPNDALSPALSLVAKASQSEEMVYAPREPRLELVRRTGMDHRSIGLDWDTNGEKGTGVNVYRDGQKVSGPLTVNSWQDPTPLDPGQVHCYAITQSYLASGNESHPAPGRCIGRELAAALIPVGDAAWHSPDDAAKADEYGRMHYKEWGDYGARLELAFGVAGHGNYAISLIYGNAYGPVITGVTAAVKRVAVTEIASGREVASGVMVMPHLSSWELWRNSSSIRATLSAGRRYQLSITDYFNMSYLDHFALYTGGVGGQSGPLNRANIAGASISPAPLD